MSEERIPELNELFQTKARLGIMTLLSSLGTVDFSSLKSQLELTDGNLSSHLRVLENAGYIDLKKSFVNRKPKTVYRLTTQGQEAFLIYLEQLETIISMARQWQDKDN